MRDAPRRRTARLGIALVLAGAVVLVGAIALAAGTGASPHQRVITIHERQWAMSPGIITVNRGDHVVLNLYSDDVEHGFYLDGYGIERTVPFGQPVQVAFDATRPGRFMFRCSVTCGAFHPYMIGWLIVRPDVTAYTGWGLAGVVGLGFIAFLAKVGWAL